MIGRNDPCSCGSGRKFKKCCLPKQEAERMNSVGTAVLPPAQQEIFSPRRFGDVFGEYCQPLVDAAGHDSEGLEKAMTFGMVFWNLAEMAKHSGGDAAKMYREMEDSVCKTDEDREQFRSIASMMLSRYFEMFGQNKN